MRRRVEHVEPLPLRKMRRNDTVDTWPERNEFPLPRAGREDRAFHHSEGIALKVDDLTLRKVRVQCQILRLRRDGEETALLRVAMGIDLLYRSFDERFRLL